MAKSNKRPLAVLLLKNYRKIHDYIGKARLIVLNIGNASSIFTTPSPTLASVTGHIDTLDNKQAEAETRVTGAAAQRDIAYEAVVDDINGLLGYVQKLADGAPDVVTAIAIISSSGFSVKLNGVIQKPALAAKNGTVSGTVLLTALGGGSRTSHEWQISPDGVVWTALTPTIKAKTEVTGLTYLSTQYFRHRIIKSTGPEAWSTVVNIVVL